MDKISLKTGSLVSNSSRKDGFSPVPILHTPIPSIQNNLSIYSFLSSLSYKFTSLSSTPGSKEPIIKIEENDNIDSDVKIQLLSSQQPLQSAL